MSNYVYPALYAQTLVICLENTLDSSGENTLYDTGHLISLSRSEINQLTG